MKEAWIVVDLGFGDAGKGTTTDFLVRDRGADLVVRFNGGAQAGHNVVTADGRHHTFAQLGAGSFVPGVGTHLTDAFLLHPGGMLVEERILGILDVLQRTTIDTRARVITPFQQAAGRLRELERGADAHGTTGVGVGETVADALAGHDDGVVAGDLGTRDLRIRLRRQQERKRAERVAARGLDPAELGILEDPAVVDRILEVWAGLRLRVLDPDACAARIRDSRRVVFEGAQGVLLDEVWGFHPHTTWSDCTFAGAERWVPDRPVTRLGVLRAYTTRHGAGPFPTERPAWRLPELHNPNDGWQGVFRVGPLDGVLVRYAAEVAGAMDGVVVTCVDRVPAFDVCTAYDVDGVRIERLDPGPSSDLGHREALGEILRRVRPEITSLASADALLAFVAERAGAPVVLVSSGPTARDKRWT